MRVRMLKIFTMGMVAGAAMLSTASASAGELAASGCHLGSHAHAHGESSWAWLLLLLMPLALRGRLFGKKR